MLYPWGLSASGSPSRVRSALCSLTQNKAGLPAQVPWAGPWVSSLELLQQTTRNALAENNSHGFSHSPGDQKSEISFTGTKSRGQLGCPPSGGSRREPGSFPAARGTHVP